VQEGLKEIIPVDKVYLLHSKNYKKFKGIDEVKKKIFLKTNLIFGK
jgi:hypothetical protein